MGEQKTALILLLILCLVLSIIPLVRAAEDFWEAVEPIPTPRRDLGVAVVDGKIYVIGGYNGTFRLDTNEMYDPDTDTWTTKEPMPIARRYVATAVYQNKIYVIGGNIRDIGRTGLNQVYDPLTDTWENRTSMPTPRHGLCANVVNNRIYLIGGSADVSNPIINPPSEKNEVYDPVTDAWTTKADIPIGVAYYASAVIDNKIYIFGGAYGLWSDYKGNFTQVYDPETDTWTEGEPISIGFQSAAAGATTGVLAPKRIYVFGGFVDPANNACNLTQVYDIETNVWSTGTPMPTPRSNFGIAVVNDVLYTIGGGPAIQVDRYIPFGYIPEFPSWIILPLFLTVTFVIVFFRKRLRKGDKEGNYL